MRLRLPLAAAVLCTFAAAACPAADWPMAGRDATRNPVSPEKGGPTWWQVPPREEGGRPRPTRNVRWRTNTGAQIHGGPVVSGGLVWVGGESRPDVPGAKRTEALLCFSAKDGQLLYRYVARPPESVGVDRGYTSSPLIDGDRLWFTTAAGDAVCLDIAPLRRGTGAARELWRKALAGELGVPPRHAPCANGRTSADVALRGDRLFVQVDNGNRRDDEEDRPPGLVCLHRDTGKVLWVNRLRGKAVGWSFWASPLVIEAGGRAQVVVAQRDGWVRAFDPERGGLLWEFDPHPGADERSRGHVLGTPVFHGGRLYLATGRHNADGQPADGVLYCLDPARQGNVSAELPGADGKPRPNPNSGVVWSFRPRDEKGKPRRAGWTAGVAVHAGLVLAPEAGGYVHCLDARTGRLHWTHDTEMETLAAPLVVDGKAYISTTDGEVHVLALATEARCLARVETEGAVHAGPAFADGVLYLAAGDTLFAVAGDRQGPRPPGQ